MDTVLSELKRMMLDYQGIHSSRRQRFAFGFNDLDRLPELRRKLADQEQHLQTWLAGLIVGGIGRLHIATEKILNLLKTQKDMQLETPQVVEDLVKTEVERSGMSGENKQVVLSLAGRYLKADRAEQTSLESQLRMIISQLPAGMRMTVTFESDGPINSVPQNRIVEEDPTDQSTPRRTPRERSPNSTNLPLNGAHAMPKPETMFENPSSREKRLERGEYRILCVDSANVGEY